MDKTKVLIIGDGSSNRLLASALEQHREVYDIEYHTLDDLMKGREVHERVRPGKFLLVDEVTHNFDFSKLEQRVLATMPNSPYWETRTGADHTSRKREPKGPRGRWGKPK